MKRTYLAALCVAIVLAGLQTSRGGVALAGVGGFWLLMLPRPRAMAVYSPRRTAISRVHGPTSVTSSVPSVVQEKRT